MIEAQNLTKRYGSTVAVDDLSFTVPPGVVTGFLGPNGAGKSTTMRMLLGLDRPSSGSALINGKPYVKSKSPLAEVGALLDAKDVHGGRTAFAHLHALAVSNGIPKRRVYEVLEMAGIQGVAKRRIKGFSLGMSQRLGIAATLLGDPKVLMFDEPVNGLDPEGIQWIRNFMRSMAAEGRTVLVSSHLMSEMALTADHLIVIGRGKLLADVGTQEFIEGSGKNQVRVQTPQLADMQRLVDRHEDVKAEIVDGVLKVQGLSRQAIGDIAADHSIRLHELADEKASLESAFMEMTGSSVEYHGGTANPSSDSTSGDQQ